MSWIALALKILLGLAVLVAVAMVFINRTAANREAKARAAHPPTGEFLTVDGVRLHYRVDGTGPPVILIHGAGGNLRDFDPLAEALQDRFTVVRFDRPGLGWSDNVPPHGPVWRTTAPSPADQAAIMWKAYARLGLGPAVVAGVSYGGSVAMAWGLNHPEDVVGLTMIAGVSNPWEGPLNKIYPINASLLGATFVVPIIAGYSTDDQVQEVLDTIFAPQTPPPGYGEMIGAGLSMRRSALRNNARQVNSLLPHVKDMAPRHGQLSMPLEIIHGDADVIVPLTTHSQPLSTQVDGANLVTLPGIGHMPHHVALDEVVAAIDRTATRAGLRPEPGTGTVEP